MRLSLELIRTDGGTQIRTETYPTIAEGYAEDMAAGATFPPIVVFHDGADFWLGDGFHRLVAAKMLEWPDIEADVRQGTVRDAILCAVAANAAHGIRRTNKCKRNAVLTLLKDGEWSQWSPKRIADQCAVSERFVWKLKAENPHLLHGSEDTRTVTRGGTTYTMNVSNIGRAEPEPDPDPAWTQTDIEDFISGLPNAAVEDEYEPDPEQRCTNCAHCVWRDAFDGFECTVFHKQTYHDAIIGETCPMWEPGPDPEADPPPPEHAPVPRFPPEHASPAGTIRWLVEELDRSLTLPPLQAARATTGDMAAYVRTARRVAGWLNDLSEIAEDAEVS